MRVELKGGPCDGESYCFDGSCSFEGKEIWLPVASNWALAEPLKLAPGVEKRGLTSALYRLVNGEFEFANEYRIEPLEKV